MSGRVRTRSGVPVERVPSCDLCKRPAFLSESVRVGRRTLCFVCAWNVVEGLSRIYAAPEITALERIRYRNEHGAGLKHPEPENDMPGWVYYIRVGDTIKIGYAKDVSKRMRAYPPNAELLAAHPGTLRLEKQVQHKFAEYLDRGREWFTPAPAIMEHIAQVVEQFGDASHLAYEYTRPKTQEERVADMFATRQWSDLARGAHSVV